MSTRSDTCKIHNTPLLIASSFSVFLSISCFLAERCFLCVVGYDYDGEKGRMEKVWSKNLPPFFSRLLRRLLRNVTSQRRRVFFGQSVKTASLKLEESRNSSNTRAGREKIDQSSVKVEKRGASGQFHQT